MAFEVSVMKFSGFGPSLDLRVRGEEEERQIRNLTGEKDRFSIKHERERESWAP